MTVAATMDRHTAKRTRGYRPPLRSIAATYRYITVWAWDRSNSGITTRFRVFGEGDVFLGEVRWWRWRCYAFLPADQTVYEQNCLRDLASFCEGATKLHRGGIGWPAGFAVPDAEDQDETTESATG